MALGPEAWDLVEGQVRTGGNDEIIVGNGRSVLQLDAVVPGMHAPRALCQIADTFAAHHLIEVDLDVALLAPANRHPGVRRHEMVARPLADHGELVALPQLRDELVGHDGSTEASSEYDDI